MRPCHDAQVEGFYLGSDLVHLILLTAKFEDYTTVHQHLQMNFHWVLLDLDSINCARSNIGKLLYWSSGDAQNKFYINQFVFLLKLELLLCEFYHQSFASSISS